MKNVIKTLGLVSLVALSGCNKEKSTKLVYDPAFIDGVSGGKYLLVYGNHKQDMGERVNTPDGCIARDKLELKYHSTQEAYKYPANRINLPYIEIKGDKGILHLRYDECLAVTRLH